MNKTIIKICDDGFVSIEEVADGVRSYKNINPDDLLQCISNSAMRGTTNSGLLPRNCLSITMCDDGGRYVSLLHSEDYADISYYGTTYADFPLPRLVFGFHVGKEGRIRQSRLGVIADNAMLKPSTLMYHYPFSNVNGFSLCTGNNSLPKCESLHTLASLPYLILQMPNNDDYFKQHHNKLDMDMRGILEHLKDKTPEYYYQEVLNPSPKTLKDFINFQN